MNDTSAKELRLRILRVEATGFQRKKGRLLCQIGFHRWEEEKFGTRKCRRCKRHQYLAWMGEGWTDVS